MKEEWKRHCSGQIFTGGRTDTKRRLKREQHKGLGRYGQESRRMGKKKKIPAPRHKIGPSNLEKEPVERMNLREKEVQKRTESVRTGVRRSKEASRQTQRKGGRRD